MRKKLCWITTSLHRGHSTPLRRRSYRVEYGHVLEICLSSACACLGWMVFYHFYSTARSTDLDESLATMALLTVFITSHESEVTGPPEAPVSIQDNNFFSGTDMIKRPASSWERPMPSVTSSNPPSSHAHATHSPQFRHEGYQTKTRPFFLSCSSRSRS
ncbi:hypothetical protein LB505_000115 [Fusarium chuoi]|nr:hypothetical protein LB505_000115 [Fusarium chuoi]